MAEAFESSNCEYGRQMRNGLSLQVWARLQTWATSHSQELTLIQSDKTLKALLKSGNFPKCVVKEVEALHHPARWYVNLSCLSSSILPPFLYSCLLFI